MRWGHEPNLVTPCRTTHIRWSRREQTQEIPQAPPGDAPEGAGGPACDQPSGRPHLPPGRAERRAGAGRTGPDVAAAARAGPPGRGCRAAGRAAAAGAGAARIGVPPAAAHGHRAHRGRGPGRVGAGRAGRLDGPAHLAGGGIRRRRDVGRGRHRALRSPQRARRRVPGADLGSRHRLRTVGRQRRAGRRALANAGCAALRRDRAGGCLVAAPPLGGRSGQGSAGHRACSGARARDGRRRRRRANPAGLGRTRGLRGRTGAGIPTDQPGDHRVQGRVHAGVGARQAKPGQGAVPVGRDRHRSGLPPRRSCCSNGSRSARKTRSSAKTRPGRSSSAWWCAIRSPGPSSSPDR